MRFSNLKNQAINLLSYNLFLRPPPIKNNQDDYKTQRFNIILERIQSYDIICFQQLFQVGSFRVQDMVAHGIQKGFQYWAGGDPVSFWGPIPVDSGLFVLSKFPILHSQFFSFGLGVFSDSSSDKGYIYCKISVNGTILHIFNVHLQASYLSSDKMSYHKELSLAARRHQSKILKREIRKVLSKNYKQGDLVLVLGDFNMNAYGEKQCLQKSTLYKAIIPEQFEQYEDFISLMQGRADQQYILYKPYKFRDLLFQNYGFHPPTYGQQATMVLTNKNEYGIPQRLDYIFQIQQLDTNYTLKPLVESCLVEKGKVEGQPFTQLSDHYGIGLKLISIKQNNN